MMNLTREGTPTLACVLNFALYPQGYFPQLAITAVVVPGTQMGDTATDSARFLNNKRIEGTLPEMAEGSYRLLPAEHESPHHHRHKNRKTR